MSVQKAPKLFRMDAASNRLVDPLMEHEVIPDLYAKELAIRVLRTKVSVASGIECRPMGRDIPRSKRLPEQRQCLSVVFIGSVVDAIFSPSTPKTS